MPGDAGALYEPLIERDLDAFPAAARAFTSAAAPRKRRLGQDDRTKLLKRRNKHR